MPLRFNDVAKKIRERFPDPVIRYGTALLSLLALAVLTYAARQIFGPRQPILYGLLIVLYFIVILGAAWLG